MWGGGRYRVEGKGMGRGGGRGKDMGIARRTGAGTGRAMKKITRRDGKKVKQ